MLLPVDGLILRRSLNQWFDRHKIVPKVIAEFEDSALLKVFGSEGRGIFPAPSVVAKEVIAQYGVRLLHRASDVLERFYAISSERRLKHPAIVAVSGAARESFFARSPQR